MKGMKRIKSSGVALDRGNIDTDQIIPKQYLKSVSKIGFGDYLFDAWRFLDEGEYGVNPNERSLNTEFILNQSQYQGAEILIVGANFGCGSSREHAVWALLDYGFKCVISSSFADIFYNNCFKNGLLPIVISREVLRQLVKLTENNPRAEIDVDLVNQTIIIPDSDPVQFTIDQDKKNILLSGLDEISVTLRQRELIEDFEKGHIQKIPWV
tara:strand:- start:167 stop:799 length:633 start_codon:yes stop_codon:yes gene_type:complete